MVSEEDIYNSLTDIFRDVFARDDLILTPELNADQLAGWDSLKQIDIIVATEQRFGIRIGTREVDGLRNVGDLVRLLARRLT